MGGGASVYTSVTPLMAFKTIDGGSFEADQAPLFLPNYNRKRRTSKGGSSHQRNFTGYQTTIIPHSITKMGHQQLTNNLMLNYTNTLLNSRLEMPPPTIDILPSFPFVQAYGGNSSHQSRRRQANHSMNTTQKYAVKLQVSNE
jgi:hypothetical protein